MLSTADAGSKRLRNHIRCWARTAGSVRGADRPRARRPTAVAARTLDRAAAPARSAPRRAPAPARGRRARHRCGPPPGRRAASCHPVRRSRRRRRPGPAPSTSANTSATTCSAGVAGARKPRAVEHRRRQRGAVELADRGQRHRVEGDERGGHHVRGQVRGGVREEGRGVDRGTGDGHHVGHEQGRARVGPVADGGGEEQHAERVHEHNTPDEPLSLPIAGSATVDCQLPERGATSCRAGDGVLCSPAVAMPSLKPGPLPVSNRREVSSRADEIRIARDGFGDEWREPRAGSARPPAASAGGRAGRAPACSRPAGAGRSHVWARSQASSVVVVAAQRGDGHLVARMVRLGISVISSDCVASSVCLWLLTEAVEECGRDERPAVVRVQLAGQPHRHIRLDAGRPSPGTSRG